MLRNSMCVFYPSLYYIFREMLVSTWAFALVLEHRMSSPGLSMFLKSKEFVVPGVQTNPTLVVFFPIWSYCYPFLKKWAGVTMTLLFEDSLVPLFEVPL